MPTIFKENGYRFFFFSDEYSPQHIHIEKGDSYARIEIETLKVTNNYNLNSKELKKLVSLVLANKNKLKEAWDDYFEE